MDTSEKNSESSNEETNHVAACYQPLSVGKRSHDEVEDHPIKRQRNEESELDEPSTSGIPSNYYNSESSAPKKTLHGLTYQLRLLMLFMQRVPDGQEFFLATEMHEAGLFDDIVLKYLQDGTWRYRFLQAKHKMDDTYKIKKIDLFNKKTKSKKKSQSSKNVGETKPYLLKKYFESYCVIKENTFFNDAKLEEFLICTNVGFDDEAITYFKRTEENDDDPILENRVDFEEINDKETNPIKFKLRKKKFLELREDFEVNSQNKNCFLNFVKKFRFLTNYEDNGLNENIQDYLKKYLKIENVDLANAYLQSRVLKWFESYKDNKSKYLLIKDKKEFLRSLNNNIESLLVAGYSNFYIKELKNYGVQFDNILPLHEFFGQKKGKIMFIITTSPKLSVIKLSQLFNEFKLSQDEFIFTNGDQLNYNKKILTIFFAEPSYKWLVIECDNETKLDKKMLANILKLDNKKTVVIIGREDNVLNLNKFLRLNASCFDDKNNLFKDLTIVSQEKILEKQIIFQGKEVNLNELIDIYSGRKVIDDLILEKLLNEKIEIGSNDAFVSDFLVDDYYIPRKLIERELKLDILQNEEVLKSCLFLIPDVNRSELKNLNINNEWIFIWENGKTIKNGIVLYTTIESKDIFNELNKNNTDNVCWLEYIKGKFFIINISNDTDILHNHIICLKEHELDKKQILEKKIIILADGPGCGKSIFMTRVARQLKQILSNIWILRINLSSYAYKQKGQRSLEDIEFIDNETDRAIEFISDLLFSQEYTKQNKHFVKELFTQCVYSLNEDMKFPTVILLFDGFDEISPKFKEKTLILLQALRKSKVAQMWVTTRNHEEHSLEVALHSSSFFLNPFNLTEKVDFFKNFWKYTLLNFDNIKPKSYSEGVVTYLTEITNILCKSDNYFISYSFCDFRKHWLPNPSYSRLEVLLNTINFSVVADHLINCLEYGNVDKRSKFTDSPLQLKMTAEIMVFQKFSSLEKLDIFSLYEEFIKYKWTIFCYDKYATGKSVIGQEVFDTYLEYLTTYHQNIAFKILFYPHDNNQVKKEEDKISLSRAGLLVIHDDRLEFVHRSFAEYFVSQYFAQNFQCENIQKIVFSDVLIKENCSVIREFLNSNTTFLEELSSKTPQMIEIIRVNSSDPKILYQMLEEDLYNLFVKFLENLPLDFSKNAILFSGNVEGKTVLHIICDFSENKQVVESILKAIKESVSSETLMELFFKKDNEQRTPLHTTHFYNDPSIIKQKLQFFKLNCTSELFYKLLLQVDNAGQTILHTVCGDEEDITYLLEVTEDTKEAISNLLLKIDNDGRTALFNTIFYSNNPALLTNLLNLVKLVCNKKEIEDLFALENDSRNLLHIACYQANIDILVIFLNAIKDYKEMFQKLLLNTDKDELSPLHYLVRNFSDLNMLKILMDFVSSNCSSETLRTLLCKRTSHGATMLHMAVENFEATDGHDSLTPLLSYLFDLVKDSKEIFNELLLTKDEKGQTVLHYSSSQLKYPYLRKELIDFIEKNCNTNILVELLLKLDDNKD